MDLMEGFDNNWSRYFTISGRDGLTRPTNNPICVLLKSSGLGSMTMEANVTALKISSYDDTDLRYSHLLCPRTRCFSGSCTVSTVELHSLSGNRAAGSCYRKESHRSNSLVVLIS